MATSDPLDPQVEVGIPRAAMPRHVGIIMDGNGRWAQQRGEPRTEGHRAGIVAVRATITHAARLGLECLTLYSFSAENWRRPQEEVNALMTLYAHHLVAERGEIMGNNVRLRQVGRRAGLPAEVLRALDETEALSAGNTGLTLCLALNYGARDELVDAMRALARQVQAGELAPEAINHERISGALYTAGLPDPDVIVRTAGENRLSNFLLWQASYAEIVSLAVLWPDFRAGHFNEALREYARRQRRYGDVAPPTGGGMA